MEFEEVKALVEENIRLIAFTKDSYKEAMERATKFLTISAILCFFSFVSIAV